MQATTTTRQTRPGQFKQMIVAFGLLGGTSSAGAAAMTLTDALPLTGGSNTQAITSPQITSDQLYTLKAVAGALADRRLAGTPAACDFGSGVRLRSEPGACASDRRPDHGAATDLGRGVGAGSVAHRRGGSVAAFIDDSAYLR